MRTAMVITRSDIIGGASIYVRDLAIGLSRLGHEAIVLVGGEGPYVANLRRHGVDVEVIPGLQRAISVRQDIRAYRALRRCVARLSPDVIAAHTSKSGALARLVGRSLDVPVVYTPHCWAFENGVPLVQGAVYLFAERLLARLPSTIVNVSNYERDMALHRGIGADRDHVLIHNGVPDAGPTVAADPGREPPLLTMVARFEPQKDHRTLLEALERLADLEWTVELVGDGPLEERARGWVRNHGLADRIAFLGAQGDVGALLTRAQLFVLMSNWESFPLTILEAMRAGLPVVAADVGGVGEAVVDGVSGYLVPRGDKARLEARLRDLVGSPELRSRLGHNGRERYLKHFTHERMLEEVVGLYSSVSAQRYLPMESA